MKEETKKYLKKRKQIISLIMQMEVRYEDDEIATMTYPDFWQARDTADKILNEIGISTPNEVSMQETSGYSLG